MGSKIDKSGFEDNNGLGADGWGRVESAGGENSIKLELPLYFLQSGQFLFYLEQRGFGLIRVWGYSTDYERIG